MPGLWFAQHQASARETNAQIQAKVSTMARMERNREGEKDRKIRFSPGETKKEEFPGSMGNMLPRNSFPQICVVSVNHSVEKLE
jgi:hypothetical protein